MPIARRIRGHELSENRKSHALCANHPIVRGSSSEFYMTLPLTTLDIDRRQTTGLVFAFVGAIAFATKAIFVKLALADGLDAVTILAWRMILSVPVFVLIGWLGYRAHKVQVPQGGVFSPRLLLMVILVGMLGYYIASYLDFAGLALISAQLARLILMTHPFFVLLLGMIVFKRRVTAPMWAALALAYSGIVVIFARDLSAQGEHVVLGSLLVGGSALAYAGYQLLAKPLIDQIGAQVFASLAMTAAGVGVIGHFLLTHPLSALAVGGQTMTWLVMAVFSTLVPTYCIAGAIGRIGPEKTAVIGNISPLVTIGLAVVILGETFTIFHALGTTLVFVGILLFTRVTRPGKRVDAHANPAAQ
jgi:drug/metabolite transporter (DMT)-like permease